MKHIPETPKEDFRNHSQAMPNHGNPLVVQSLNRVNTALRRWIKCPVVRWKPDLASETDRRNSPCRSKVWVISIHWYIAPEREIANTIHIQLCHDAFTMPFSYLGAAPRRACRSVGSAHRCSSPVRCSSVRFSDHPMLRSVANPVATPAPWWWRSNGI